MHLRKAFSSRTSQRIRLLLSEDDATEKPVPSYEIKYDPVETSGTSDNQLEWVGPVSKLTKTKRRNRIDSTLCRTILITPVVAVNNDNYQIRHPTNKLSMKDNWWRPGKDAGKSCPDPSSSTRGSLGTMFNMINTDDWTLTNSGRPMATPRSSISDSAAAKGRWLSRPLRPSARLSRQTKLGNLLGKEQLESQTTF